MNKNKILITGGLGFIGSHIAKSLLNQKKKVVVFDNLSRGKLLNINKNKNLKIIIGDIRKIADLEKCFRKVHTVIHCAAINGTKNFYEKPIDVLEIGTLGIINLLKLSKKKNVKNFFLASSSEVYHLPSKIPTDENIKLSIPDVFNPRFSYGASKIISEQLSIYYGKKFFKKTIIFRPHNVYGPQMGNDHVIPELINKLRKNNKIVSIQGTGKETRSFIYIDDFITGFNLLLKKGKNLNIYNIGTQERVGILDLAKTIFKNMHINPIVKKINLAKGGTPHRCPDIKKIKKLGFRQKYSLNNGIKKMLQTY